MRGRLFTPAERGCGKVSWLFGAAFIPEGAAPFALADPLRVLPATLAGSAVTGTLTMTFGSKMTDSAGGVFAIGKLLKSLRRAVPATTDVRASSRRADKLDAAIA